MSRPPTSGQPGGAGGGSINPSSLQPTGTPQMPATGHGLQAGMAGPGPALMQPDQGSSTTHATVYATAYSDIPVFEAMVRNVAVMMRRSDMWLNATQILKVAGVNKTARTKYLDREISKGVHQKIQGGYGKYQGTWVPYQTGVDLAKNFGVLNLLEPVFSLQAHAAQLPLSTPSLPLPPSAFMNKSAAAQPPPPPRPGHGRTLAAGPGQYPAVPDGAGVALPFTTAPMDTSRPMQGMHGQGQGGYGSVPGPQHPNQYDPGPSSMKKPQQQQQMHPHQHQQHGYDSPQSQTIMMPPSSAGHHPAYYQQQPPQSATSTGSMMTAQMLATPTPAGGMRTLKRPYADSPLGGGEGGAEMYMDQYGRSYVVEGGGMGGQGNIFQQGGGAGRMGEPPAKRMRTEEGGMSNGGGGGGGSGGMGMGRGRMEDDVFTSDEAASEQASRLLAPGTKLANRPSRPGTLSGESPRAGGGGEVDDATQAKTRAKLLAIFQAGEDTEVDLDALLAPDKANGKADGGDADVDEGDDGEGEGAGIEVDQVIDDKGHTALHWAAALARDNIIAQLIARGADIDRGNFSGESPLIRAILSTNNADRTAFSTLLSKHLGGSVRTVDNVHRTVLHHISLVAGIKGRGISANYYMSTLLEWLADKEGVESLRTFVDLRDLQGDTALNVCARVGNKNMVKLLLDAGADPSKMNKIGLRPTDYGLDVPGLELVNGMGGQPTPESASILPFNKGSEMVKRLSTMIQQLNGDFHQEIGHKQDSLDRIHASVVIATRELAEERKKITSAQQVLVEVEQIQQQIHNIEQAINAESSFEWYPGQGDGGDGSLPGLGAEASTPANPDPVVDTSKGPAVIQLRRIKSWQARTEEILQERLKGVEGSSAEKLIQYRKVIAVSLKIPVEKVDEKLLQELTKAVDNDGNLLDSNKMASFVQRLTGE